MPIFEYQCMDCNEISEILLTGTGDLARCKACGSGNLKKLLSAPSAMSGSLKLAFPGPGDTTCCGSTPGSAAGCAGPGSCCGKAFDH